jgi:predicted Zn-dependent protease
MQMDKVAPPIDLNGYLGTKFGGLTDGRNVNTSEDQAYAGVATISDKSTGKKQNVRVSMITRGEQAFIISGQGKTTLPNESFFAVTKSVRKLKKSEQKLAQGRNIKLITARRSDTIASLAAKSGLSEYAEAQLRLINDLYPSGEPTVGQKLKIIE